MIFYAFGPFERMGGDAKVMQRRALIESEVGRMGRGVDGEYVESMLRRGESIWLCLKFQFSFFAGLSVLIRVLLF
jgi:hypothetical protein